MSIVYGLDENGNLTQSDAAGSGGTSIITDATINADGYLILTANSV